MSSRVSSQRDTTRVSRTNKPWARFGRMSPTGWLMQNVEPSTSVTASSTTVSAAGSPANVQGWVNMHLRYQLFIGKCVVRAEQRPHVALEEHSFCFFADLGHQQ